MEAQRLPYQSFPTGMPFVCLVVIIAAAVLVPTNCLFCRTCDAVQDDDDCDTAHACQAGEICFHDVLINDAGASYMRLGCRTATVCTGTLAIVGKRANPNLLCSSCCNNDLCKTTACHNVDYCLLNPCVFGTCNNLVNDYTCTCIHGYGGKNCDTMSSPCLPNPCVHGRCTSMSTSASGYRCACNSGYSGKNCDAVNPCVTRQCMHGTCSTTSTGTAKCVCDPGYNGAFCDTDIDECTSSPCQHGTCLDKVNDYLCTCILGYTGKNCDQATYYPCSPNPCVHGTCSTHSTSGFTCTCNSGYKGALCDIIWYINGSGCKDVPDYHLPIHTDGAPCDFTDGGGWTVIMSRQSNVVNFRRSHADYSTGFGISKSNFWIGLDFMHQLTSDVHKYQLKVELTRADDSMLYEVYDDFSVGPRPNFVLLIGAARGTAGDALRHHNGYGFTTFDRDLDSNKNTNCAQYLQGGWWFHECYDSCLTCPYETPGYLNRCRSMSWNTVNYCEALKTARMLVRQM